MKLQLILLFIVISILQSPCKLDLNFDDRGDLISSKFLSSYLLNKMKSTLVNSKYNARYAVKTYKIIYETEDAFGHSLRVSGLLAVPQKHLAQQALYLYIIIERLHKTAMRLRFYIRQLIY